ncbi:MAG: flippase [Patescibacteria group bacterium]
MNNTQKIALNTGVQLVGKGVTVATSVLIIAYLTRYLGVAGYGDYATIFAYLGVFGVMVDLGLFVIAVREIAKTPQQERSILGNILGLKIALSVAVLGGAYLLTWALPYTAVVRQGILIGAISQLFISLNQVPLGSFQANLTMYKAALSDVVGRLAMLGLVWWLIYTQSGLLGMIWAVAAANAVVLLLNIIMVGAKYWLLPLFEWPRWKKLFVAALPMGVVMALGVIYFRIDILLLAAIKGSFAVGIYSAPYKALEVLLAVPSIFMSSVLPVMTIALAKSTMEAARIFQKAFNFLSLAALPLIAGTLVAATPVMLLIAGQDFILSGPILRVLILAIGGSFLNSVMIYTIMAANQQSRLITPYVLAVVFNVAANLLLIPRFSYWGAAVVTVATEFWVLVASMYIVWKYLHFSVDWRVFSKTLFCSAVMGGLLYYLRDLAVWWIALIGVGVYGGLVMLTRAVTWAEILEILPRWAKN